MIRKALLTALVLSLGASASAQDADKNYSGNYVCKMTASGGVKFDKASQKWVGTTFDTTDDMLVLKITDTGSVGTYETAAPISYKKYNVEFKNFGETGAGHECVSSLFSGQFSEEVPIIDGRVSCRFFSSNYILDLETRKLQIMFEGGFAKRDSENYDTPYMSVGTCEKL